jgi:hypothetical protein
MENQNEVAISLSPPPSKTAPSVPHGYTLWARDPKLLIRSVNAMSQHFLLRNSSNAGEQPACLVYIFSFDAEQTDSLFAKELSKLRWIKVVARQLWDGARHRLMQ